MTFKLAILGCGNLGQILARGVMAGGWADPQQIVATCRSAESSARITKDLGIATASNPEAAEGAEIVLIAVKPRQINDVLDEIAPVLTADNLVVSVAAGASLAAIAQRLARLDPVVRAMPNLPSQIGEGFTALAALGIGEADRTKVEALFETVGRVAWVNESDMDAVTAVSGSGPAYFAYFCEAMIGGAEQLGLTPELSRALVVQTAFGTAAMLKQGHPVDELRQKVTSPGGTTEAALQVLETSAFKQAVEEAMRRAKARSEELRD